MVKKLGRNEDNQNYRQVWGDRDMKNGKWKLVGVYPALVVSSGNIFLGDRHPKGLYIDEVLGMIKAHPNDQYYGKKGKRRVVT